MSFKSIDVRTNTSRPIWFRQVVSDLDRHEGFRPYAYPDPLSKIGKSYPAKKHGWGLRPARAILAELGLSEANGRPWTFGHGFTKGVTVDSSITKEQSTRRLEEEVVAHTAGLERLVPKWNTALPVYVVTVLVNMAYNLGIERLSKFTTTLDLLNRGQYAEAGVNLRKSAWYKQVGNSAVELTERLINGKIAREHMG